MGVVNSTEDTRRYREGYPDKLDNPRATKNLRFYSNELPSKPDGDLVEDIHSDWFGDYALLEKHHGYIQWIFPIRESGMNFQAQELQLHEADTIRSDPVMKERVRRSYEMMLDFYGMRLVNRETGEVGRADHFRERYDHLNRSFHNYLRISRILKSLGELGYEHYKLPFITHVLEEIYEHEELVNCKRSCLHFWSQVLRRKEEQDQMRAMVESYEGISEDDVSVSNNDNSDDGGADSGDEPGQGQPRKHRSRKRKTRVKKRTIH